MPEYEGIDVGGLSVPRTRQFNIAQRVARLRKEAAMPELGAASAARGLPSSYVEGLAGGMEGENVAMLELLGNLFGGESSEAWGRESANRGIRANRSSQLLNISANTAASERNFQHQKELEEMRLQAQLDIAKQQEPEWWETVISSGLPMLTMAAIPGVGPAMSMANKAAGIPQNSFLDVADAEYDNPLRVTGSATETMSEEDWMRYLGIIG